MNATFRGDGSVDVNQQRLCDLCRGLSVCGLLFNKTGSWLVHAPGPWLGLGSTTACAEAACGETTVVMGLSVYLSLLTR